MTSRAAPRHPPVVGVAETVGGDHVHGQQLRARGSLRQPGAPSQQGLALGAAGDGDHDALLGRPRVLDPVRAAVVVEGVVHPVGQPQQRELAQGGEVADPEVRRQRRVDLVGAVDVAVRHPPPERFGDMSTSWIWSAVRTTSSGTVSRCRTPVIRSTSSLRDSRCWMLRVVITSMPAARICSTSCRALGVPAPGDVGVRELVDQRDRGPAGDHGVGVHLGEDGAAVARPAVGVPPRARPAAPRCARGRASRRTRRRRRSRAPDGAGPRRAWRRSCRRRERRRGRP